MQTIEINTTQNVVITYEVAPVIERILAFAIDLLILIIFGVIAGIVAAIIGDNSGYLYYLLIAPIFIFYSLFCEIKYDGQSPGKRAMKIKVVKLNGKEPATSDYVLRWIFRFIDIYLSIGTLATIFISSSKNGQRIGDLLAETSVIRLKPSKSIEFSDIGSIDSSESYIPVFQSVRHMTESEMLLIQKVIKRYNNYPNKAHEEALNLLVDNVKKKLSIELDPSNSKNIDFLKTLIKDYVVLTR